MRVSVCWSVSVCVCTRTCWSVCCSVCVRIQRDQSVCSAFSSLIYSPGSVNPGSLIGSRFRASSLSDVITLSLCAAGRARGHCIIKQPDLSAAGDGCGDAQLYASAESRIRGCAGKPGSAESHESMEDASDGTLQLWDALELISGTQPDSLRHSSSSTLEPAQVHFCLTSSLYRQS